MSNSQYQTPKINSMVSVSSITGQIYKHRHTCTEFKRPRNKLRETVYIAEQWRVFAARKFCPGASIN